MYQAILPSQSLKLISALRAPISRFFDTKLSHEMIHHPDIGQGEVARI